MSAGWYRSSKSTAAYVIHEGRCPRKGGAHPWALVEGMPYHEVLAKIAEVPWLRLCEACADRLRLEADDPARYSDNEEREAV